MRWPENVSPVEAARKTFIECPRCGGVIEDKHKAEMNARGRYVAPGQKIDHGGKITGKPSDDVVAASYWVSGLCSPFKSFGDRVQTYLPRWNAAG